MFGGENNRKEYKEAIEASFNDRISGLTDMLEIIRVLVKLENKTL